MTAPQIAAGIFGAVMRLELLPLLAIQRELYQIPRSRERFDRYLEVMIGGTRDLVLPLPIFNPMGNVHAAEALDRLIALDAERVAERAIAEAGEQLSGVDLALRVALVLADDAKGGWTNRFLTELEHRIDRRAELARGWTVTLLWTSEVADADKIQAAVRASIYRTAWLARFGRAQTLGAIMLQEGHAGAFSTEVPNLDDAALERARAVIDPLRQTESFPQIFASLYGDEAAVSVGHRPLGLAARAGYALAQSEAGDPIAPLT